MSVKKAFSGLLPGSKAKWPFFLTNFREFYIFVQEWSFGLALLTHTTMIISWRALHA